MELLTWFIFTYRESKIVGWQIAYSNIHVKASGRAYICPPVCIELSQFRVMKLTWPVCYHIVRDATNSLYHSRCSPTIDLSQRYHLTCALRCLLSCAFSPLLTYVHSANTLKRGKEKCAGGRISLVRIPHRRAEGCRRAKSSCPFDEKGNKIQERPCMTVNYPGLRNILQLRGRNL